MLLQRGNAYVDIEGVSEFVLDVHKRTHKGLCFVHLRANVKTFELELVGRTLESLRLQPKELGLAAVWVVWE